jgi:hypothetical protein
MEVELGVKKTYQGLRYNLYANIRVIKDIVKIEHIVTFLMLVTTSGVGLTTRFIGFLVSDTQLQPSLFGLSQSHNWVTLTESPLDSLTTTNDSSARGLLARARNLLPRTGSHNCQLTGQSQSQSYVTTDDQSVSKSWFQGPWGSHDRIFISVDIYEYCFIDWLQLTLVI